MFRIVALFAVSHFSASSQKSSKVYIKTMLKKGVTVRKGVRKSAPVKPVKRPFVIEDRNEKVELLPPPIKSESDKKDYRVIKLHNGLTALLISDPTKPSSTDALEESTSEEDDEDSESSQESETSETSINSDSKPPGSFDEEKLAAVAISVGVGSYSDPSDIQGLAHFVEHMVFMGSKKYPKENDFDAFIRKKGGSDNASTDCEQTTFYFEIHEKHLQQAMDKFSQFFVEPLMVKEAMQREREAIQSEFAIAAPSDSNRKEQLLSALFPSGHPAKTFTWGNIKSLKDMVPNDDYLYDKAHEFRKRHYSAHRMKVAIQARLDLDTIQRYVVNTFGQIPNNGLDGDDFKKHDFLSPNQVTPEFASIYYIKPVADVTELHMTWVLPSLIKYYKSKPDQYLSFVLGHEGKGSLLSYLKKKVWALGLYSGNDQSGCDYTSIHSLFRMQIILTAEGLEHKEEVAEAVFSYLRMLREAGPSERIFNEIKSIEENNFKFEEESSAVDYVEELVEDMFLYPSEHYITGDSLYYEYNPKAITHLLEMMTPDAVNVIVFSNRHTKLIEFDKTEPWFGTQYRREEISAQWVERWSTVEAFDSFKLPEPNIFIPTDFGLTPIAKEYQELADKLEIDLLSSSNKDIEKNYAQLDDSELTVTLRDENFAATVKNFRLHQPNLLRKNSVMEVWYKPDFKFRLPTAILYMYLITPLSLRSAKDACLLDVWTDIVQQDLKESVYPANMAGISLGIYPSDLGVMIKIHGYSQNLHLLSGVVTKEISTLSGRVNQDILSAVCDLRARAYHNTLIKPSKLNKIIRIQLLADPFYTAQAKAEYVRNITVDDFLEFHSRLLSHFYMKLLVQGNLKWSESLRLAEQVHMNLNWTAVPPNEMPKVKVRQIPKGEKTLRIESLNKDNTNTIVTNYYQTGVTNPHDAATIEVIIMMLDEPLFDRLRTKEQLGYAVFGIMRSTFNVIGYSITVNTQADKFTAEHVDERIESFLEWFAKDLRKKSDKGLQAAKTALLKQKHIADLELKDEADRHWKEIVSDDYCFGRLNIEAGAIEKLTINEVREWFAKHYRGGNKENYRKLSVQVVGFKKVENATTDDAVDQTALPGKYQFTYLQDDKGDYIDDIDKFKSTLPFFDVKVRQCKCEC